MIKKYKFSIKKVNQHHNEYLQKETKNQSKTK